LNPTLLIAGHGYLGQEIARQALATNWQVTALTKSGSADSTACDLSSEKEVGALAESLFDSLPLTIVHCASSGRGGAEAYRAVFLDGTRNLLAHFPGAHLIFVSSSSVYGQTDGSTVDETSPTEPARETSALLLEAEQLVLAAGGTVTRLAGIYGPERSVILKKFLNQTARLEEDGRRILNQIHRDDAAAAILHLARDQNARGEIYNVADSSPLSQLECYQKLSKHFSLPLPESGPRPENSKRAWTNKAVSNRKLLATDWTPEFPSFVEAVPTLG
jgi:nucleoside-diphosphate-sugar epimerase